MRVFTGLFHRTFTCLILAVVTLLSCSFARSAEENSEIAAIKELLLATQPEMQIEEVSSSPVDGLYEVTTPGRLSTLRPMPGFSFLAIYTKHNPQVW
jgi:hypothetical protein